MSPYYGWLVEILTENIHPDFTEGEVPEIPLYETSRGPGSTADVDFWTSREPREVMHSHLNYVAPDTAKWEQAAAHYIDTHTIVDSFVKTAGLGLCDPILLQGQMHDYIPDFIARLKGYDPLSEVKRAAAERWVAAVNAESSYGKWAFRMVKATTEMNGVISGLAQPAEAVGA